MTRVADQEPALTEHERDDTSSDPMADVIEAAPAPSPVEVDGDDSPAKVEYEAGPADDDEGSKAAGVVLQLLSAVVVLAVGTGVTWFLISQKTAPAKLPAVTSAPVVDVLIAEVGPVTMSVRGFGRVAAASELAVVPQVGGRVISVHPQLRPGGVLPAESVVFEIDPTDYELAVEQAEADLERANAAVTRLDARRRSAVAEVARRETSLETMQAEAEVSRAEFERLNPGQTVPPLVAREPQLRENESLLEAARAAVDEVDAQAIELQASVRQAAASLRQANVSLDRTKVKLPAETGSWRVASESVDTGQTVVAGQSVASLYATSSLEVPVPLEDDQLGFIAVPGATATVDAGGTTVRGKAVRTGGEVDDATQLVEVIVALDEPSAAFVPGRFVEVSLDGEALDGIARLPRRSIERTEAGTFRVRLADDEGLLRFRQVDVVRRVGDAAFVRGLSSGDRVITTPLEVATDGMPISVRDGEQEPNEGEEPSASLRHPEQSEAEPRDLAADASGTGMRSGEVLRLAALAQDDGVPVMSGGDAS
ncbi:MAG: HlyD family efflux transporter periplasmic adaptor subunit [Planctomycetota bacterium]